MALILSQKRERLLDFLASDSVLREFLRRRWRTQLDIAEADSLTAETLDEAVAASESPARLVAAALLHADEGVARQASRWAEDLSRIVARQPESPQAVDDAMDSATPNEPVLHGGNEPPVAVDPSAVYQGADDPAPVLAVRVAVEAEGELGLERTARLLAEEKLDQIARDLAESQAARRRLEAENLDLRAKLPSRADKRRANKERGELQRAARQLMDVTHESEELRVERDSLLSRVRRAEDALDEAAEARKAAERARRSLEARLETTSGRAEYLRRSLESEIETATSAHEQATGKDKTKARKRHADLVALRDLLDGVFPTTTVVATSATEATPSIVIRGGRDVRVVPLGGAEEIGGSALLVCLGERRILVDAGTHPRGGGPRDVAKLEAERRLDAVIVTHAHNDHAGYIPALLQRFPSTPVIASTPTAQLLPTMWEDAARVMKRAFEDAGEDSGAPAPLYGETEVEEAEARITEVPYHRTRRVAGDVEFTLFPAGHILGAAGVVLEVEGHRIVVTGDITAPSEQHLAVQPTHLPRLVREAALLVIESTYCHSKHANRQHEVASLVDAVRSVVERRGRVLIPAFGLGRAQEVAMILARELPEVEVLVDGLARTISHIYEKVPRDGSDPLRIFTGRVRPVENHSREVKSFQSGVIVSTSGMLNGGPAVDWAREILPDENDALLLCGYQDEYAPGHKLDRLARLRGIKDKHLELPDIEEGTILVPVRAQVAHYRLSAHADKPGLLDIIGEVNPASVMLVHGEADHQQVFRHEIIKAGHQAVPTRAWTP